MQEPHEGLIGIEEAARFLSVKVSWLYEQVRLQRLPSYRVGKFRRFRVSELEAWLLERRDGKKDTGSLVTNTSGRG